MISTEYRQQAFEGRAYYERHAPDTEMRCWPQLTDQERRRYSYLARHAA